MQRRRVQGAEGSFMLCIPFGHIKVRFSHDAAQSQASFQFWFTKDSIGTHKGEMYENEKSVYERIPDYAKRMRRDVV